MRRGSRRTAPVPRARNWLWARLAATAAARPAFPLTHVPNLLAAGLQGNDFRTAAYTGVIVLAMAAVGTRVGWKRPEMPALAVVTVVTALLTFFSPASNLLHVLPRGPRWRGAGP